MEAPGGQVEIIERYFNDFTSRQKEQLRLLETVYTEWNERINVISRKDIAHLYERHVLHSLAIAAVFTFAEDRRILDIGTGGGFPGIPLAIFFPTARFHLVDSIGKKIKVVEAAVAALGLDNVEASQTRAETLPRGSYDFVVSRAVAPLKELWAWSRPLLRGQGGLACLKGGQLDAEIRESGLHPRVWEISSLFREPWFAEKYLLHLTR